MDLSSLDVLCCQIRIGDADERNPMKITNPILLTEVQSIEINESYKKLINTAKVVFPKGTVFRSTLLGPTTLEGKDASRITTEIMESGIIIEKRSNQATLDKDTIKVGQRINIKIGYNGVLKNKFDGYITEYNSESLFEAKCENMAYKLKLAQAPKFETSQSTKINDVLGEKYGLLKGTGFEIHSETKSFDIDIGKIKVTDNFTVADILLNWSKYKVYCFLKYDENSPDDMPRIAVGRPYSSAKSQPSFPGSEDIVPFKIYFDYHVAASELKVVKVEPKFLAVRAQALGSDEKFFEATVRLNPDYDPAQTGSKEFQTINATQISKKSHKITGNITAAGAATKTKVDLSTYTVIPYMSPNMRINSDTLVEEAIEYFKSYNLNGVSGSITLFGDFGLSTAVQVELIDKRNTSKNGIYIVEEVTTSFGTQGYRQKITLPYRLRGEKTSYGKQEKR
nr:MAG TPA: tail protein [Caudoviricetes sp.]